MNAGIGEFGAYTLFRAGIRDDGQRLYAPPGTRADIWAQRTIAS